MYTNELYYYIFPLHFLLQHLKSEKKRNAQCNLSKHFVIQSQLLHRVVVITTYFMHTTITIVTVTDFPVRDNINIIKLVYGLFLFIYCCLFVHGHIRMCVVYICSYSIWTNSTCYTYVFNVQIPFTVVVDLRGIVTA